MAPIQYTCNWGEGGFGSPSLTMKCAAIKFNVLLDSCHFNITGPIQDL